MHSSWTSAYPRARTLTHPGPFNPVRIQSRRSGRARHLRLQLSPGATLFDALVKPLIALGIDSASTTLLGGAFDSLQYCTAPPDPNHQAVIAYTAPVESGRTWMVFGNATIAKGRDLRPLVHCHATMRTEAGVLKGGHVIAQTTVVGAMPISVFVTALEGFELRVAFDPETNIPLIQPMDAAQGTSQ